MEDLRKKCETRAHADRLSAARRAADAAEKAVNRKAARAAEEAVD